MHVAVQHALIERFARHRERGTTDMADASLRVPAEHYIDPRRTAIEVQALFRRGPLLVALTPDVPQPGQLRHPRSRWHQPAAGARR